MDYHNGVVPDLEPDIMEYEVKWAFESITTTKASGRDRIPAQLFQILKDDAVEVLANLGNSTVATGLEKVSFHSNPKVGQCQNCSDYLTIAVIPHVSKVMLKDSRYTSKVSKWRRNQRSNCQHLLDNGGSKGIPEKYLLLLH